MSNSWNDTNEMLTRHAVKNRVPFMGTFELTPRCNLQCKMCYIRQNTNDEIALSKELPAKEWIRIGEEARDAGMLHLLLTGGEVLVRQDFREIYEALSMMGFFIQIATNATLVTLEIAKWLGGNPPAKVDVTLYGASPEMYGKICGYEGGYRKAVEGIDLLLREGISVNLRTTAIRENAGDFDALAGFADEKGLEFAVVDYIQPRREGSGTDPVGERLSPSESVEYMCHVKDHFDKKYGKPKIVFDPEKQNATDVYEIEEDTAFGCASGKCSFWLAWDGRMLPCGDCVSPYAAISDGSFVHCWKQLQKKVLAVPKCKECMECQLRDYCKACPARLKNETGYFDKPAQYLCDIALLSEKSDLGG